MEFCASAKQYTSASRRQSTQSSLFSSIPASPLHFPPLHSSPDLQLLTPGSLAPVQRFVLLPHHVVIITDPLLRKYTSTQRPCRQLYEKLELCRQATVDRMDALEEYMCKNRDGGEAEGSREETARCFGGDLVWRKDWRCAGGGVGCRGRRRHSEGQVGA